MKTLFDFDGTDGAGPRGPLVQGLDGNFYGTTGVGGTGAFCPGGGCGTLFNITPAGKETVLYNFCSQSDCTDGIGPIGNLALATGGNFYGVTLAGGLSNCVAGSSCGTLFEITPAGKLTTLHMFCSQANCADGGFPSWLVRGADGNFYGTTDFGGAGAECVGGPKDERFCGTVFRLRPTGKLTTIHSFCSEAECTDGAQPTFLLQAANGNFYGTTSGGGTNAVPPCNGGFQPGCGTIFELTPGGKLTTLYSFCSQTNCTDGLSPNSLLQASDGNFYGTTFYPGSACTGTAEGCGTVFEITAAGKLTTLYRFCAETNCADGFGPVGLIQSTDGNFYGTTSGGGEHGKGTMFEITRTGKLHTVYSFCAVAECADGWSPNGPIQATNGKFYGTTAVGGTSVCDPSGCGTVFRLSVGLGPFVETLPTSGRVGAKVIILGNNLSGTTAVSFNGTAASFNIVSSTEITTTVPKGATTGTVKVNTSTGTLNSNAALRVTPHDH